MSAYTVEIEGDVLKVGFGARTDNDVIAREAHHRLNEMNDRGEFDDIDLVKINGPMSMPVAMVLALELAAWCRVVACYDPKLDRYVVVASEDSGHPIGELI